MILGNSVAGVCDELAAGFVIAKRDIAPIIMGFDDEHSMAATVATFAMLANILHGSGVSEDQLVKLAREGARIELREMH